MGARGWSNSETYDCNFHRKYSFLFFVNLFKILMNLREEDFFLKSSYGCHVSSVLLL